MAKKAGRVLFLFLKRLIETRVKLFQEERGVSIEARSLIFILMMFNELTYARDHKINTLFVLDNDQTPTGDSRIFTEPCQKLCSTEKIRYLHCQVLTLEHLKPCLRNRSSSFNYFTPMASSINNSSVFLENFEYPILFYFKYIQSSFVTLQRLLSNFSKNFL